MQFLKEWATGLVVISLIASIVFLLSPSKRFEKQVKTAVSIVLLAVIVGPFFNVKITDTDLFKDVAGFTGYSQQVNENAALIHFTETLIEKISKTLEDSGYKPLEVMCDAEINDENELSVNKVTVYIDETDSDKTEEILRIIKEEYGILAQVEVSD